MNPITCLLGTALAIGMNSAWAAPPTPAVQVGLREFAAELVKLGHCSAVRRAHSDASATEVRHYVECTDGQEFVSRQRTVPDDSRARLAQAKTRAAANRRTLMVVIGADWCSDCGAWRRALAQAEVRATLAQHYEWLEVDVGQFDRNLELVAGLGCQLDRGIPVVVFLQADGRAIGQLHGWRLTTLRNSEPEVLAKHLQAIAESGRILP